MRAEKHLYLFEMSESCDITAIVEKTGDILCCRNASTFVYLGLRIPGCAIPEAEQPLILTNAPSEWAKVYRQENRHLSDPIVKRASESRLPFHLTTRELPYLWTDSNDVVLPSRPIIVAPIHGPECELAVFIVLADPNCPEPFGMKMEIDEFHLLSLRVHATVVEYALETRRADTVVLTGREKECLLLTARGKTAWEISKIMGRSRGTVNFHLQNAMRKLNAVNKTQAAARAIETGLLT